jgi:hypothetical protein
MPYTYAEDIAVSDIAFQARGQTLEDTFQAAADATVHAMVENPEAIAPVQQCAFELRLASRESKCSLDIPDGNLENWRPLLLLLAVDMSGACPWPVAQCVAHSRPLTCWCCASHWAPALRATCRAGRAPAA